MTLFGKTLMALLASAALVVAQNEGERKPSKGGPVPGAGGKAAGAERKDGPKGERNRNRNRDRPRGGDPRRGRPLAEHFLATHDHNKDEAVSFEEFQGGEKMAHLQREGKRRIFNHLDKNKDGTITREELPKGGGPPDDRKGPIRGDLNKDGKITLEEFRQNPRLKNADAERVKAMFERLDRDKDGVLRGGDFRPRPWRGPLFDRGNLEKLDLDGDKALSLDEWKKHPRLKDTPADRLQEMFERIDRNKDGKLNEADRVERPGRGPGEGPGGGPEGRRRGPGTGPGGPPADRRGPGSPPPIPPE